MPAVEPVSENRPFRDRLTIRGLRLFYITALVSIGVLSATGGWILNRAIQNQSSASRVVNISGRQRMLSQRLVKWSLLLGDPTATPDQIHNWGQSLREDRFAWIRGHRALKYGDPDLGIPPLIPDPQLQSLFENIEPQFGALQHHFNNADPPNRTPALLEKSQQQSELLQLETDYVALMDAITFRFDEVYAEQIESLKNLQWRLLIASLLVLLAEALFIFRPIVRMLDQRLLQLERTEQMLKQSNEASRILGEQRLADQKAQLGAVVLAEEGERRRIAYDLHDSLGQMLLGVRMTVSTAVQLDPEPALELMQRSLKQLDNCTAELKHILSNLSPPSLDQFGLVEAMNEEIQKFQIAGNGLELRFQNTLTQRRFDRKIEFLMFRIFQELLSNAVRHAQAQSIEIQLIEHPGQLTLMVEDDGVGFVLSDASNPPNSNGISHLKSRMALLNGTLTFDSNPGQGTTVIAQIPLY